MGEIECLNTDCDGILEPITSIDSLGRVHMYICDICFDRESGDIKINLDLEYYKSVLFYTKHHYWEEEQSDRIIRENSIIEETEKRIKELKARKEEFVNVESINNWNPSTIEEFINKEPKVFKLTKKMIDKIELHKVYMKFKAFNLKHECCSVSKELIELRGVIKNEKNYEMVLRFIIDICEEKND